VRIIYDDDHIVGGIDCNSCMGSTSPYKHKTCGGLVHVDIDTDEADWDFAVVRCDVCDFSKSITLYGNWENDLLIELDS
jgi:hypothetical protein